MKAKSFLSIILLALSIATIAPIQPASAADCDGTGQTWPSNGNVTMTASQRYSVTMKFKMTADEICQMKASEYLEVQYTLFGFSTKKNWDNYAVNTNLPGGRHDVDFHNDTNKPAPAVTAIKTKDLVAGAEYNVTIGWQEPLQKDQKPQIIFNWVPSHMASRISADGVKCYAAYDKTHNPGWCIFPNGKDKNGNPQTVSLFGSKTFQNGTTTDGKRDITDNGNFWWYPTSPGGQFKYVLSSNPAPTPAPANKPPIANFSYIRLTGAGNKIALDSNNSFDPDGAIKKYMWYNGTSSISTDKNPTISLGSATSAVITLTVTDDRGDTGSIKRTINADNRPPRLTGSAPANNATTGTNTPVLSASAVDDDADLLEYYFRIYGPSADVNSGWIAASQWSVPASRLDPGTKYTWTVQARDSKKALSSTQTSALQIAMLPTAADVISTASGNGYWQVDTYGGVFSYGDAQFYGSLPGKVNVNNITGMVRTPDGKGYWLVGTDGGVFAFGNAQFAGSLPGLNIHVNNIVGMAATKTGHGYWLVGSDGGVFSFGDAVFHGSMGGKPLSGAVVGIAPTASGNGYWLGAKDGGIFAFGDAPFYGSMGGQRLNYSVADLDAAPDGAGYWMTAEDGGVFAFGSAKFYGSMAGKPLNGHISGMSVTPAGTGYWLTGCDGGIFAFGNAVFRGSNPTYRCRGIF